MKEVAARFRESLRDQENKDRGKFVYCSDQAYEYCWVEPNSVVRQVIGGELIYGSHSWTFDPNNEGPKGFVLKDEAAVVAKHDGEPILCEALDGELCLQNKCPLFLPADATKPPHMMPNRHGYPLCVELKMMFVKQ